MKNLTEIHQSVIKDKYYEHTFFWHEDAKILGIKVSDIYGGVFQKISFGTKYNMVTITKQVMLVVGPMREKVQ